MENILQSMLPAAEKRMLSDGSIQFHWEADGRENSITIFSPENAAKMREFTKNCNDIVWAGDVRFSSTI
jgi:hypothetical protein